MLGHRQLSAGEYGSIWRRRWPWVLLPLLFGAAAGYLIAHFVPPRYTSSATVREVVYQSSDLVLATPEFTAPRLSALKDQVLTPERVEALIARFGLYSAGRTGISGADRIARMQEDVAVSPAPAGFTVSFTAPDASIAQQLCAELVSLFRSEELKNLQQQSGNQTAAIPHTATTDFLARQVDEAKRTLDEREAKLSEFKRRHASDLSPSDIEQMESRIAGYQAQLQDTDAALKRALQQRTALTEILFAPKSAVLESREPAAPPATAALEQELAADQAQLVALQARYTADYPDVVKLKNDIEQLQKKIAEAKRSPSAAKKSDAPGPVASAQAAQIQAQIRDLDAQIQEKTREQARLQQDILDARARLDTRPLLDQEYKELSADAATARALYTGLLDKQSQALKAAQAETNPLPVVEPPNRPDSPSFPNPLVFTLAGAASGLLMGLLGIVAGEMRDKSLRTEGDVEHFLDLPTLAVIPAAGAGDHASGKRGSWPRGGGTANRGEKEQGVLADV